MKYYGYLDESVLLLNKLSKFSRGFIKKYIDCLRKVSNRRRISINEKSKIKSYCRPEISYYTTEIFIEKRFGWTDLLKITNWISQYKHEESLSDQFEKLMCLGDNDLDNEYNIQPVKYLTVDTFKIIKQEKFDFPFISEILKNADPDFYEDPYGKVSFPPTVINELFFGVFDKENSMIHHGVPIRKIVKLDQEISNGYNTSEMLNLGIYHQKSRIQEFLELCEIPLLFLMLTTKREDNEKLERTQYKALRQNYHLTRNLKRLVIDSDSDKAGHDSLLYERYEG